MHGIVFHFPLQRIEQSLYDEMWLSSASQASLRGDELHVTCFVWRSGGPASASPAYRLQLHLWDLEK